MVNLASKLLVDFSFEAFGRVLASKFLVGLVASRFLVNLKLRGFLENLGFEALVDLKLRCFTAHFLASRFGF